MNKFDLVTPYAVALFEATKQNNNYFVYLEKLKSLTSLVKYQPFSKLLLNPKIAKTVIVNLLTQSYANNDKLMRNLLLLLIDNKKLHLLPEIYIIFNKLIEQQENYTYALIETATIINEGFKLAIQRILSKKFACIVKIKVATNPHLIGGMKIFIKGYVFDASIKTKLQQIASQLVR